MRHERTVLHVVGDRFSGFAAKNDDVIVVSELERRLRATVERREGGLPAGEVLLIIGQGIASPRLALLRDEIRARHLDGRITLDLDPHTFDRASSAITHKHREQNIMLSEPLPTSNPETYESSLLLDDECAEMSDHTTGQHVQGTILIEVARQMGAACTEKFYSGAGPVGQQYLVINQLDAHYYAFTFPLRATVRFTVQEKEHAGRGGQYFEATISIVQAGDVTCDVIVKYTAYDVSIMATREGRKAQQILETLSPQPVSKAG